MPKCKCCGVNLQIVWIDRSEDRGDKVSGIGFKYGEPYQITYAENYAEPNRYHRNDIALINTEDGKQYVIYPSLTGPHGDGMQFLSATERKMAKAINARMLAAARIDPAFAKAMNLRKAD